MKKFLSTLFSIFSLILSAQTFSWVKGVDSCMGTSVKVDYNQDIYISGAFYGTADLDPGPNTNIVYTNGLRDAFIQKIDQSGNFIWAKAFGGHGYDYINKMILDSSGNIYVTGAFTDTVDFDPSPISTYTMISQGIQDVFIEKLDHNGNFLWAKSFGGPQYDEGSSVTADRSGNIYILGYTQSVIDINPSSSGTYTVNAGRFISKFSSSGNFIYGYGMPFSTTAIATGPVNELVITGAFSGTIDFDSGPGTDIHTSNGSDDIFVSKMDSLGGFVWARTFGSNNGDRSMSLYVDSIGNIFSSGSVYGNADYDPTPNTDIQNTPFSSIYLQKLFSNGNYGWARTMTSALDGGWGYGISEDHMGNIFVVGVFEQTFDFNPGPAIDTVSVNGGQDYFFEKFDPNGNYIASFTFGSFDNDFATDIDISADNSIYVTGTFADTVDFDPSAFNIANLFGTASNGYRNLFIQKFSPVNTTSVHEFQKEEMASVYPNPGSGIVYLNIGTINMASYTVKVSDVTGKQVMEKMFHDGGLKELDIKAESGIYMVEITDRGLKTIYRQKIVIQK